MIGVWFVRLSFLKSGDMLVSPLGLRSRKAGGPQSSRISIGMVGNVNSVVLCVIFGKNRVELEHAI